MPVGVENNQHHQEEETNLPPEPEELEQPNLAPNQPNQPPNQVQNLQVAGLISSQSFQESQRKMQKSASQDQ